MIHTEAVFFLRKVIFETAQKQWPELLVGAPVNQILNHTFMRQQVLESNFETELISKHGFNSGMEYSIENYPESCQNVNIIYRTFLTHEQAKQLTPYESFF